MCSCAKVLRLATSFRTSLKLLRMPFLNIQVAKIKKGMGINDIHVIPGDTQNIQLKMAVNFNKSPAMFKKPSEKI